MSTEKQLTLPVIGMTCANCVKAVERNSKKVEGVIVTIMLKTNNFVLEGQIQQIKDNYLNFS